LFPLLFVTHEACLTAEGETSVTDTLPQPVLERASAQGVAFWTDPELQRSAGVVIAFSERGGGASRHPFTGLNLAGHVGDEPDVVDANRELFLRAIGVERMLGSLTTADQVHGTNVTEVEDTLAGSGACVVGGRPPIADSDALATTLSGVGLLLFFADCVPIVLVAPGPAIAVVHAGWRGALGGIAGDAARRLAAIARCETRELSAYVGAHIGPCHYEVDEEIMSRFVGEFDTFARAESGGLDLGSVVSVSLTRSGVDSCRIAALGTCTAESTERFFSYRAEGGLTGRHGAFACILSR